jgi:hypothetical protein
LEGIGDRDNRRTFGPTDGQKKRQEVWLGVRACMRACVRACVVMGGLCDREREKGRRGWVGGLGGGGGNLSALAAFISARDRRSASTSSELPATLALHTLALVWLYTLSLCPGPPD